MNQLQTTFHLPDFIMTEISRHLHQLYLTEVNQEYHQTWGTFTWEVEINPPITCTALISKYRTLYGDRIWLNEQWRPNGFRSIYHFRFRDDDAYRTAVDRRPAKYWYTSGHLRQDGYQYKN